MVLTVSGDRSFSLSAAQRNERNILVKLQRSHATKQLFHDLWHERKAIEAVVAHHLGRIDRFTCTVQDMSTWLIGQFNVCVVVHIHDGDDKISKKIFRCPMYHKVGEQYTPGSVDEKMRAEVATYAWIETNSADIPIPFLHGFGLSSGLQFTHRPHGTGYTRDPSERKFDRPYLLLEYIDRGRMLSDTLQEFRATDPIRMQNLCRGISRIMLSLASKRLPRIGSHRFNDDGSTTLTNRPLFCTHSILESEGAPRALSGTYTTSASFVNDMLRFREEAFCAEPNAVNDEEDCYLQMLHLTLSRRLKPHFVRHSDEPFVLQFTDFHASTIFVDDDWNIVALIDLEFVCALPPRMMSMPHWLSVDAIDDVCVDIDGFHKIHDTFMEIFRKQERSMDHENVIRLSPSIQEALETYSCWYYQALTSINGVACSLEDHIYEKFQFRPSLAEERLLVRRMSLRWSSDPKAFVERKLRDKAKYNADVASHFRQHQ